MDNKSLLVACSSFVAGAYTYHFAKTNNINTTNVYIGFAFIVAFYMIWQKQETIAPQKNKSSITTPVLYFMFAPWCGHSKKAKPEWDKLVKEHDGKYNGTVSLVLANSEDEKSKALFKKYDVRGFPTFIYVKNEKESAKHSGKRTAKALEKFMKQQQ